MELSHPFLAYRRVLPVIDMGSVSFHVVLHQHNPGLTNSFRWHLAIAESPVVQPKESSNNLIALGRGTEHRVDSTINTGDKGLQVLSARPASTHSKEGVILDYRMRNDFFSS
ncbi:hypothetical protein NPIL_265141 [Nephila pilipes]|uniref:Uncharacterized protein n=1 Tax=Nephila pilipes TaxID=299642 RepID=A0A8X6MUH7_NEPPI|nr:hypothetical protein NPIL_265141 [Nephila pilipes]